MTRNWSWVYKRMASICPLLTTFALWKLKLMLTDLALRPQRKGYSNIIHQKKEKQHCLGPTQESEGTASSIATVLDWFSLQQKPFLAIKAILLTTTQTRRKLTLFLLSVIHKSSLKATCSIFVLWKIKHIYISGNACKPAYFSLSLVPVILFPIVVNSICVCNSRHTTYLEKAWIMLTFMVPYASGAMVAIFPDFQSSENRLF